MRRIKQKIKELNRSTYKELAMYKRYFWDFKKVMDKKNILTRDIYNINKTGFRIGVGGI